MTAGSLPVRFRAPAKSDVPFVVDSWVKSARATPAHAPMWSDVYARTYVPIVDALVRSAFILVAYYETDRDHLCGWIAWDDAPSSGFVLHYVYVKDDLRRDGLATMMVKHVRPNFGDEITTVSMACTPRTPGAPTWPQIVDRWKLRYSPYSIMRVREAMGMEALGNAAER